MTQPRRALSEPLNICGPRVREARRARKWSQAALATQCQLYGWDISRDTIANIEHQRSWVGDIELQILAHILGTTIAALLPPGPPAPRVINPRHHA